MNINITSTIDSATVSNDYRNMNASMIVDAINQLAIDGHTIVSVTDLDNKEVK